MTESYVDMLKQEFLDKKSRRPQYSERAFARDLSVSSGFISLLFNGKRSLSPKKGLELVQTLNWSEVKIKKFMGLLQDAQFVASPKRKDITKEIQEQELQLDEFRLISNAYHFIVLGFLQTRKGVEPSEISDYFDLEIIEVEMILKRLYRLGMIELDGMGYKASSKNLKLSSVPSEAVRAYHKQVVDMAYQSIEEQSFEKRELKALILSIDSKKIKQAKKSIATFFKGFNEKFGNKKNGEIYQLNVQLFSHKKEKGDLGE